MRCGITRATYRADFAVFRARCDGKGAKALPAIPETVAAMSIKKSG
jgi:hypothetical protein